MERPERQRKLWKWMQGLRGWMQLGWASASKGALRERNFLILPNPTVSEIDL